MKKIFNRKKEEQEKQMLKEGSVFGYFTVDRDKFDFYLHNANMELQDLSGTSFYQITKTYDKKYPYLLNYVVKELDSVDEIYYKVTLNITKKEKEFLEKKTAKNKLFHVEDVMLVNSNDICIKDFFDLPIDEIERVELNLFAAYSIMANYQYVPSKADGEYGTCYKKLP